ncbi:MAG: argininosuccinate lyase [Dehalococcoidales bacterium]|nr:argininosuccinate lyase [Dehalococcoidales bacterium]
MSLIRSRFRKAANKLVAEYTVSTHFDWRLYPQDIAGSIAHARMLARQQIISEREAEAITEGLDAIREEIEQGKFQFKTELEDIHMNIESRLIEKIGEVGRKLHTARSRNDQVALDLRLFTREKLSETLDSLKDLQQAIVGLAEANKSIVMPGYTHLQPAQPVLLAHHLLAYFEMLQRDNDRFRDCLRRVDVMPLGSGAVAGVTYNVDRHFLARELGFSRISQNSMDAVSDRDFVLDYESAASLCMMHLSRLAEEIVLWSSHEFGFIELDEAYATGSSIMPQKKNPDIAELARGKTGRVYGRLTAMLVTMKALPLSYNRDLQEDKEGLFDTIDTLLSTLKVFTGMISAIKTSAKDTERALKRGYILATDLADYLVRKGESFRSAHGIVAGLVGYAERKGKSFSELDLNEYKEFSPLFEEDVRSISIMSSLTARDVIGGTAPEQVEQALAIAKKILNEAEY